MANLGGGRRNLIVLIKTAMDASVLPNLMSKKEQYTLIFLKKKLGFCEKFVNFLFIS